MTEEEWHSSHDPDALLEAAKAMKRLKARKARHPELLVEQAVKGMIPHNRLGRQIFTKLKVYSGSEHPHRAQQPTPVTNIK